MKISVIIALLFVAAGIGVIISSTSDVTTYADFTTAAQTEGKVKIVGQLVKDQPIEYNPEKDPNYLSFFLEDDKGGVRKVVLKASKPQDFERSESIVLTGTLKDDVFVASDMLMKCPSKYKNEETFIRAEAS